MSCKKIVIDDDRVAFICNLSGFDCEKGGECDTDGEPILFGIDGTLHKQSDCPEDPELANEFYQKNKINGGACSCSKCGKPFSPPMF